MTSSDYRCQHTVRVYEVKHPMAHKATTWGELCALGGLEPGDTPADAPVERLLSAAGVVGALALKNRAAAPCGAANGCGAGGSCAYN